MTTGKHTLLVKVLAVTSSVSDQVIGIYSWMSSAFCNAVYNGKIPMFCITLLYGKKQFFTYPLQSPKKKKYGICDSVLNHSWCTRL